MRYKTAGESGVDARKADCAGPVLQKNGAPHPPSGRPWYGGVAERGKVSCRNRGRSAACGPVTVVREITMQSDPVYWIHIGLPKTATTTIQYFLAGHRDALLQRGVLYPRSIARGGRGAQLHHALGVDVEPESFPWLAGMRQRFAGTDIVASLLEEVDRAKPKTVILSSEALAFMRRPNLLRRALPGCEVRILVYLRRQDSFLASFYNQLIKSRLYAATFEEFLRQSAAGAIDLRQFQIPLAMCHYDRLLELWSAAFGRDNILPGVFEDCELPAGLLGDFAAKTGIDIAGLAMPGADTNPALQLAVLPLKRRVNGLLASEEERIHAELMFTACSSGRNAMTPSPDDVAKDMARRLGLLAAYRDGNNRVAKDYFVGRSSLFREPDERDSLLPDANEMDWQGPSRDAAVHVIAELVASGAQSVISSGLPIPENDATRDQAE
jgi:hypothetical protein